MSQPDIVLGEQNTTVIGQVDVGIDEDSKPNIQLTPDSASVRLGGGDGKFSAGELLLTDEGGNVRFRATGDGSVTLGDGAERHVSSRALIDADTGNLELGAEGLEYGEGNEYSDIKLAPNSASLRLGGGGGDYSEGDLRLTDKDGDVRIHASAGGGSFDDQTTRVLVRGDNGELYLGAKGLNDEDRNDISDVTIRPKWASLTLGGGGGSNSDGDIKLQDREDNTRIHLDGKGNGPVAPETTSLHVNGETGTLRFRPPPADGEQTVPMFYMFSGPTGTGGPRDWTKEDFPSERPIAVVSPGPSLSRNGLFWTMDSQFVVKGLIPEGQPNDNIGPFGGGLSDIPTGDLELHQPLTVDVGNNRVGIKTTDPQQALDVNGNVKANNLESVSDARCKQNVETVSKGLKTVRNLRGVRFEWDDESVSDRDFDDEHHIGFVAQELEQELPEAVSTDDDGLYATIGDAIAPVLVEAIKDQQELIERQRDTIGRQQATLDDLESRVDRLEDDTEPRREN